MDTFSEFEEMEYHQQRSSYIESYTSSYTTSSRIITDYRMYNSQSIIDYNNEFGQFNPSVIPKSNAHASNSSDFSQRCRLSPKTVKFREIPFYDPLHILLEPRSPVPVPCSGSDRAKKLRQKSSFSFRLSPKEVRDVVCNHECQILLRFCKLETGIQDDHLPPHLAVKVNGKPMQLEAENSKTRHMPLNITQFTEISSTAINVVTVSWPLNFTHAYAITSYIAKPISSSSLVQKLRDHALKDYHFTTSMIVEKIKEGQDLEIATTSIQASLLCPLGKFKMKYPCRATTCTHIACFDASVYIKLNRKNWKWQCPLCDKRAFYKDLEIDELFLIIISNVPQDCTSVQFFENGLWAPIMPSREIQVCTDASKSVEVIDISSDNDTDEEVIVD